MGVKQDVENKIILISRFMNFIISRRRTSLPVDGLSISWPGEGDPFGSGEDIIILKMDHQQKNEHWFSLNVYPDYVPLSWAAVPLLFSIYKRSFTEDKKDDIDMERMGKLAGKVTMPRKYVESTNLYDGIQTSLPWAIFMHDWDDDPELTFFNTPDIEWEDTMLFKNDRLEKFVKKLDHDTFPTDMYIGIVAYGSVSTIEVSNFKDWKKAILKQISAGYVPTIVQASSDYDEEDNSVIYWLRLKEEW